MENDTKKSADLKEKYGQKFIGRVVRILSNDTVIVDCSLIEGTKLHIYEYMGSLKGLDNEDLGSLEYVKATIEVTRREPKYSICKTSRNDSPPSFSLAVTPLLYDTIGRDKLPLNTEDISPMNPTDRFIRVGDPIKRA